VGDHHRRNHRDPGRDLRRAYGGAVRAGLGRTRAVLLAGGAAVVLGGWFTASAVIAGHGWYHARPGHGVPWLPVAAAWPADHGSANPLIGPATAGTVTSLLRPADRGTTVSLMGPADPGTATPVMLPSR
jgi:hypothetical protein